MTDGKCCGEPAAEEECCAKTEPQIEGCGAAAPEDACCETEAAKTPCCAGGTAQAPVLSVVYERNVHAVANHSLLAEGISLEGCCSGGCGQVDPNPMDLMSLSLAGCLLVVMGQAAKVRDLCMVGARADVSYEMTGYRLAALTVDIHMPRKLDAKDQARLEAASRNCPVFLAINPEVTVTINYQWPE